MVGCQVGWRVSGPEPRRKRTVGARQEAAPLRPPPASPAAHMSSGPNPTCRAAPDTGLPAPPARRPTRCCQPRSLAGPAQGAQRALRMVPTTLGGWAQLGQPCCGPAHFLLPNHTLRHSVPHMFPGPACRHWGRPGQLHSLLPEASETLLQLHVPHAYTDAQTHTCTHAHTGLLVHTCTNTQA